MVRQNFQILSKEDNTMNLFFCEQIIVHHNSLRQNLVVGLAETRFTPADDKKWNALRNPNTIGWQRHYMREVSHSSLSCILPSPVLKLEYTIRIFPSNTLVQREYSASLKRKISTVLAKHTPSYQALWHCLSWLEALRVWPSAKTTAKRSRHSVLFCLAHEFQKHPQSKEKQVRLVSVKAERPNHQSHSHARQGGGGGGGASTTTRTWLH